MKTVMLLTKKVNKHKLLLIILYSKTSVITQYFLVGVMYKLKLLPLL